MGLENMDREKRSGRLVGALRGGRGLCRKSMNYLCKKGLSCVPAYCEKKKKQAVVYGSRKHGEERDWRTAAKLDEAMKSD